MSVKRAGARSKSAPRPTPADSGSHLKTVRFSEVVKACGNPEALDLWSAPDQNRTFMAAVRQNRVLTIRQKTVGTGKDFGVVGFVRERNVSYLVFPKPLTQFADRKVVGIKYELVRSSAPIGRVVTAAQLERSRLVAKPKSHAPAVLRRTSEEEEKSARIPQIRGEVQSLKKFRVVFEFFATARVTTDIQARSEREARELAAAAARPPDLNTAPVTRRLISTKPVE